MNKFYLMLSIASAVIILGVITVAAISDDSKPPTNAAPAATAPQQGNKQFY